MSRVRSILVAILLTSLFVGAVAPVTAQSSGDSGGDQCGTLSEYESTDAYRQCLAENTSGEQVLSIIENPPSEVTTKQKDRVYAVHPQYSDQKGLTEDEQVRITDWMTWDMVGLKPAWADSTTSGSGSNSSSDSESSGPQSIPATLAIEQPEYVDDDVQTQSVNGTTMYVVNAGRVDVQPQSFDAADVVGFGVETDAGQLTYDDRMQVYEFDAQNETGTFRLYWEVEETRVVGSGENATTEDVTVRYSAVIKVAESPQYAHLPSGDLEQQREDAENWSTFVGGIRDIAGENADVQDAVDYMFNTLMIKHQPLAALSGNFTAIVLLAFSTLGGLLFLALIGAVHLLSRFTDIKYINRFESLKAEEKDIDEKLSDLQLKERLQALGRADWNDLFDDYTSRAYRNMAETPKKAINRLTSVRRPVNLVNHRLQAMGQLGYRAAVEEAQTDGGDDAGDQDADIVSAHIVPPHEDVPEGYRVDDLADPSEPLVREVMADDEVRDFNLVSAPVDVDAITVEQTPMDLEELMVALEIERDDFDSVDEWGDYLVEFVEFVHKHDYTDDHGSPNEIQFILNEWMDTDDLLGDAFDIPQFKYESEAIARALIERDPVADAEAQVDDIVEGRW